jgi:hypothetical protein
LSAEAAFARAGDIIQCAPVKSPVRMFGAHGNPQAKNLFAVIGYLQKKTRVRLRVTR